MRGLIFKRLLDLAGVLLGVSILVFLMIRLIPGDAAQVMLGASGDASEEQVQQLRLKLGLNDPVPVQYLRWIGNMAQGDFGVSIWTETLATIWPSFSVSARLACHSGSAAKAFHFFSRSASDSQARK